MGSRLEVGVVLHVELNNSRYGIAVSAKNAFSFNASYYTQEELEEKKMCIRDRVGIFTREHDPDK